MPRNIFIDLNVIVDVFLAREGFESSQAVLQLDQQDNYRLFISAHTVTTLAYILEGAKIPRAKVGKHIKWVLDRFNIVPVDGQLLRFAAVSRLSDYEDAVIEQAALNSKSEVIITRNIRDFRNSSIPAMTPKGYLHSCPNQV